MDGLIFFLVLFPVVFLILLLVILSKSSSSQQTLESLRSKINQLGNQLYKMDEEIGKIKNELLKKSSPTTEKEEKILNVKPDPVPPPPVLSKEEKSAPVFKEPVAPAPIIAKQESGTEKVVADKVLLPQPITPKETAPPAASAPKKEKTDWEKFIGENLANKIGIAVLVLGISFFVKFAIDKNWINEGGRVIIGLVSGGILVAIAHYVRNTYRSFSSVLVGGGLTVFYFTIAFAFHQYQLIGQQAAFIVMVIISAFAVILSIMYDRMELAVLASIGGFVTPFLVSTGQNNYVALFTYLCILNAGLLVLSWFKRWKAINIIALFFTMIIYGGWLVRQFGEENEPFPYQWALFFATLFYFLSLTINIVNNLKLKIKFGAFDFILLLVINFLYYVAGITILQQWDDGDYKGLFTASLGVLNLLLAWIFFKQKRVDKNFIYLLIGLTLTFISLTAPIQLKGNHITLFWAAETVVLFWLYRRSRIFLLKIASLLLIFPLLVSLFMDWVQVYAFNSTIIPVIANKGFITTLVTAAALLVYYSMMRKEADNMYLPTLENKLVRNTLLTGGIILSFASGAWEIYYQFSARLPGTGIYAAYMQLYCFLFIMLLLPLFKKTPSFGLLKFMLTIAGFAFYLVNLGINYNISWEMLTTGNNRTHFLVHWISGAFITWLLYDLIGYFRKQTSLKDYVVPFTWISTLCLVIVLSVEMYHVIMWTTYSDDTDPVYWENLYYRAGLSILWGICSFSLMWLGMKNKFKPLRIISLSLFTITILKLFFYDIRNVPPGGKIAAFILLGVLLLIVSFMYQRLKKIIMDDAQKE